MILMIQLSHFNFPTPEWFQPHSLSLSLSLSHTHTEIYIHETLKDIITR
jgi:hypothetical protein